MDDWRGWIRYFQYENIQKKKDLIFLYAGSLDTSEILNPEFGVWETGPTLLIDSKAGCAVTLNDEETKRWEDIKKTFQKNNQLRGLGHHNPIGQLVAQVGRFADEVEDIKDLLGKNWK